MDNMLVCIYAKHWLILVEQKTDQPVEYYRSEDLYNRVSAKARNEVDERQIKLDVPRTFPEEPFYAEDKGEGRTKLHDLLCTISKHSSSAGYTQGLNYVVASLLFHCGEVLAFEMTIRALNDYHLKEVHMSKLPGLYYHCDVIRALLKVELPDLTTHFESMSIDVMVFCQNWIMCIFTQVVPLNQVQRLFSLFWRDGWLIIYRLILCIFLEQKAEMLYDETEYQIQQRLKNSNAMKSTVTKMDPIAQRINEQYWAQQIDKLEHGSRIEFGGESHEAGGLNFSITSFEHITDEYVDRIKKEHRIY